MKRHHFVWAIVTLGVFVVAAVTLRMLPAQPSRGLILTPRGFTNQSGKLVALVGVSNIGSSTLSFSVGTEVRAPEGWVPSGVRSLPLDYKGGGVVVPGTEKIVPFVVPSTNSSWRAVADTSQPFSTKPVERLIQFLRHRVGGRSRIERWFSPDYSPTSSAEIRNRE